MKRLIAYTSLPCLAIALSSFAYMPASVEPTRLVAASPLPEEKISIHTKALQIYEGLCLAEKGLSREAFDYAYKGYARLVERKKVREGTLTVCDFSQSSAQKRLYIIDLENSQLILNTYVAHGKNSGGKYAKRFSNRPSSLQSSLGFYTTRNIYTGEHGPSLRMAGLEPGFNDKAYQRAIVIHGADYIEETWKDRGMGRSFGCPAVPRKECKTIINAIKDGTCLFIYHPSAKYLKASKILNG